MMKKVISLILVAVMLLGVLPATTFAETSTASILKGYTLSLGDSIALEFYAEAAKLADFQKLIFKKDGNPVQTITTCPAAESDGLVYFKFDKLGPQEMDASITAELYLTTADEAVQTATVSILNYCTAILSATSDEKLKKLIVDMLSYGAAAETYTNDGTAISTYINGLPAETQALAATGDASVTALSTTVLEDNAEATVTWQTVGLLLNAGIVPYFTFTTEADVTGLTAVISCAGKTWQTNKFTADGTSYTIDFTGLNPSQLRNRIYVELRDAQGNTVSDVRYYTAEHYTASAEEAEKALTHAMMHYGDAVRAYVFRGADAGILTAEEETALQNFTGENVYEYKTMAVDAYAAAGIDLVDTFPAESVFTLAGKLFDTSNAGQDALRLATDDAADEMLLNMLVPGYYGGNRNTTGKTFTPDDFKVGDLFVGVRQCPAAVTASGDSAGKWNNIVGVYQGNGKFLIFDSHNSTACEELSCESTVRVDDVNGDFLAVWGEAEEMNAYRLYFVLRPQRVFRRDITTGALTTEEMAALKNFTGENVTSYKHFVKEAYEAAGIDVSEYFATSLSVFNQAGKLFNTSSKDAPLTEDTADEAFYDMLLPGYYGGSNLLTGKTFDATDFKVGDVFFGVRKCPTSAGSWNNITGIYQGNGVFRVFDSHDSTSCTSCTSEVVQATKDSSNIVWGETAAMNAYRLYFVLRPERLAPDALQSISLSETTLALATRETATLTIAKTPATAADAISTVWTSSAPAVATVDQNGKITALSAGTATITANCDGYTASCEVTVSNRNITSGALNAAEMAAIASYEPNGGDQWYTVATAAYDAASISVDAFNTNIGFNDLYPLVFSTTESDYTRMLVPGFYGGASKSTGKSFTPDELKVGDIFCTAYGYSVDKCPGDKYRYVTALYVGNDTFRVNIRCCTTNDCIRTYDDVYGTELTNGYTSLWSDADTLETVFKYYFVLRPERLAPDALQSISLNKTELTINPGYEAALTVTKNPAAAAGTVTWTSSADAVATVDQNGKVTGVANGTATITAKCDGYTASCEVTVAEKRLITAGGLSAAEQAAIANFVATDTDVKNVAQLINKSYEAAGIDVYDVFTNLGFFALAEKIFYASTANPDTGTKDYTLKPAADQDATYAKMLVEGYYGNSGEDKVFTASDFEIGDLFIAGGACPDHADKKWHYVAGVYQGNGKFMIYEQFPSCGCTTTRRVDQEGSADTVIWGGATSTSGYAHYFVLRPSNLAN